MPPSTSSPVPLRVPDGPSAAPAAPSAVPFTSEPLTWPEICARYPDEWVCLVEIGWQNETDFDFTTARVVAHGKTRKEPLVRSREVRAHYGEFGNFYTGKVVSPLVPYRWLPTNE